MARIILESGADRREYRIAGPLVVGRQKDGGVFLDDPQLSRQHTRFHLGDEGYLVTDLGSKNGTRLNGRPVTAPTLLRPGDRVAIGSHAFVFVLDPEDSGLPEEARTPRGAAPATPTPAEPQPAAAPATRRDRAREGLVVEGPPLATRLLLWIVLLALLAGATYGAKEAFTWALRRAKAGQVAK